MYRIHMKNNTVQIKNYNNANEKLYNANKTLYNAYRQFYNTNKYYPYGKTGELPTSLPMGCTWATGWAVHGNFAMQIRLPPTPIFGNSGQLSRQPTASKYKKVGSSVGSGVGCPWEFFHAI